MPAWHLIWRRNGNISVKVNVKFLEICICIRQRTLDRTEVDGIVMGTNIPFFKLKGRPILRLQFRSVPSTWSELLYSIPLVWRARHENKIMKTSSHHLVTASGAPREGGNSWQTALLVHQFNSNTPGWEVCSSARSLSSNNKICKNSRSYHRVELTRFCCSPKNAEELVVEQEYTTVTGTWMKDRSKSSSMEEACDLVALPFIYRKAIGFLNKLVLVDDEHAFKTVLKAGGVLDVEEEYPWTGVDVVHSRRDKRRGTHRGSVCRTEDGFPSIKVKWSDPYGGTCVDTFELVQGSQGRELKQSTSMSVGDKSIEYFTFYHRKI